MKIAVAIAIVLQGFCGFLVAGNTCKINYKPPPIRNFPVIASGYEVLFPNIKREIVLKVGDDVSLLCPPENKNTVVDYGYKVEANVLNSVTSPGTCKLVEKTTNKEVNAECTNKPKERIRITGEVCDSTTGADKRYIGWDLPEKDTFFTQIEICFDKTSLRTIYAKHVLKGAIIKSADVTDSRVDFRMHISFGNSKPTIVQAYKQQTNILEGLFREAGKIRRKSTPKGLRFKRAKGSYRKRKRKNEDTTEILRPKKKTATSRMKSNKGATNILRPKNIPDPSRKNSNRGITNILRPTDMTPSSKITPKLAAEKYIDRRSESYLARGHLSPNADFFYSMWQSATFYYMNAVPQWQKFNNGNWKKLESKIRDEAATRGNDFEIYTGTHQVLQLEYQNRLVDFYLLPNNKAPVPKYIWKIVLDQNTGEAVAFILHNDPPLSSIKSDPLCRNICRDIMFVKNELNDKEKGVIDCCNVRDLPKWFHQILPQISSFNQWS